MGYKTGNWGPQDPEDQCEAESHLTQKRCKRWAQYLVRLAFTPRPQKMCSTHLGMSYKQGSVRSYSAIDRPERRGAEPGTCS